MNKEQYIAQHAKVVIEHMRTVIPGLDDMTSVAGQVFAEIMINLMRSSGGDIVILRDNLERFKSHVLDEFLIMTETGKPFVGGIN